MLVEEFFKIERLVLKNELLLLLLKHYKKADEQEIQRLADNIKTVYALHFPQIYLDLEADLEQKDIEILRKLLGEVK